jgi:hypothetical protein
MYFSYRVARLSGRGCLVTRCHKTTDGEDRNQPRTDQSDYTGLPYSYDQSKAPGDSYEHKP